MYPATIWYHLLLGIADVFFLIRLNRKITLKHFILLSILWICASLLLAVVLGENGFGHMRLFSYGILLHSPVLLAGSGVVSFRQNKFASVFLMLAALFVIAIGYDAFFVEPFRLQLTSYTIRDNRISSPIKIVVVSDLQTDSFGEYERTVLAKVLDLKPDLILMTGDYLQPSNEMDGVELTLALNRYLRNIRFGAPMGIFAVRGDVEGPAWHELFTETPVKLFDETQSLHNGPLLLTALSRPDSRNIDLQIPGSDSFHIVFGHSPNFARGDIRADLLIAGHTHGGQIQIPMIGPLYVHSKIPLKWADGLTPLDEKRNLIVSKGIGMERGYAPRLRFWCPPELVLIYLIPK